MSFRIITGVLLAMAFPGAVAKAQDADGNAPKTTMGGPPTIYSAPPSHIPSRGLERRYPDKDRKQDGRAGTEKPCDKERGGACRTPDPRR